MGRGPRQINSPEDQERETKQAEARRQQELRDLREVFSTDAGKRLLWRHLERCHVFSSSYRPNNEMTLLEGHRDVGLRLMADLAMAYPGADLLRLQEAKNAVQDAEDRIQAIP
jgi:hypothetical protein